ncbi:hypothetical protein P7C73_g1733, partial [Tremellales sp. Uapishka_1]
MAPLHRSFSLPVSMPDVSRLKVFSGAAGKDEVSKASKRHPVSPHPSLDPVQEGVATGRSSGVVMSSLPLPSPSPIQAPLPLPVTQRDEDGDSPRDNAVVETPQSTSSRLWGRGSLSSFPSRFRRKTGSGDASGLQLERTESMEEGNSRPRSKPSIETALTHSPSLSPSDPDHHTIPSPNYDEQTSDLILNAFGRQKDGKSTLQSTPVSGSANRGATGGALAALGLRAAAVGTSPTPPSKIDPAPAAPRLVVQPSRPVGGSSSGSRLPRAPSPFFRARRSRDKARARDASPEVGALKKEDTGAESDGESVGGVKTFRPQVSAYEDGDESATDVEVEGESDSDDEEDALWDENGEFFDKETEMNTEANAVFREGDSAGLGGTDAAETGDEQTVLDSFGEEVEEDILGEGPNVVVPPEPLFPSAQPRRRKSVKTGIELVTSRPVFARDRCTITLTHGDPDDALEKSGKRLRRYVVLSDLSEESQYAVEWAIGTVARDGDEVFLISVKEDESKALRIRVQKDQVTGLLQRTTLQITVTCQTLHAKNARYMLLDLIDFLEPTMVIVGSRGLGKLKGILLGSTSHYLVQKSSVPVMVARRRLQRPLRKTDPANLRHSPRVSLASASIEKTASSRQEDDVMDVEKQEEEGDGVVTKESN